MLNATAAYSHQPGEPDGTMEFPKVPLAVILGLLSFLTVIGNSLVCIAIYIHPALHHVTYMSIFSLAVADLLVGSVAMPSYIVKKTVSDERVAHVVCDTFRFSYFLTGYASILSLCVVSADRLCAVKRPLTYVTTVTRSRVKSVLILVWIDVLVVSSIPFASWPGQESDECNYTPTSWWSIMVIVSNVIVPFVFIVTCYAIIYTVARKHVHEIVKSQTYRGDLGELENKQIRKDAKERRANRTIMIVIGVFVVSWFPSSMYYFLQKTCPTCFSPKFTEVRSLVNTSVKILTFSSSLANPLIYCWRSKEFRAAFIRILLQKKRRFADALTSSFRNRSRGSTLTSSIRQGDDEDVVFESVRETEGTVRLSNVDANGNTG